MRALRDVVAETGIGPLEAEVFGTADPGRVAEALGAVASAATARSVLGARWYRSSVDAVAGVVLDDGSEIVVRAHRPTTPPSFVDAVVRVQRHLAGHGFPCPAPLGGPVAVGGVLGRVERLLVDPGARRPAPDEMEASAAGLARVVGLCVDVDPAGLEAAPMALPDAGLYPTPHSPVFDFDATASGAEWIDEIAVRAREAMDQESSGADTVIGHGDWSARNVRLGPTGVVAAYDWESLLVAPETLVVGVAAATWSSLGAPGEPMAPSAAEIDHYVSCYERARGRLFAGRPRRAALAAAVYALAYTARCEHAIDPGTTSGRASGRLAADGGLRSLLI